MVEAIGDRRVAVVTGSTDGLGAEVARRLGARGWHVVVHGRDPRRGEPRVREIDGDGSGSAAFCGADFADLSAVSDFAHALAREYDRLDLLVNNAEIPARAADQGYDTAARERLRRRSEELVAAFM